VDTTTGIHASSFTPMTNQHCCCIQQPDEKKASGKPIAKSDGKERAKGSASAAKVGAKFENIHRSSTTN